jgi:hypothetical protein
MNATTDVRRLALGLTIGLAALALRSTGADALQTYITPNTAQGTLTAVGEYPGSSSVAKAEVLINGKCNSQPLNAPLEIIISSGALSGTATETNSLSMKNAYSTMLAALLSGKTIDLPIQLAQAAQPPREAAGHDWRRRARCLSLADRR